MEFHNLRIYTFEPSRQADGVSCGIISWNDILMSNRFDLFGFVEVLNSDQYVVDESDRRIRVINFYPPEFMKVRQSVQFITGYENDVPASRFRVVSTKPITDDNGPRVDKRIRDVVEKHTKNGRNSYTSHRACKYFYIVAKAVVERGLAS